MSQIAALLMMYLSDEEDVFWGLHRLMYHELYSMHGFFAPGFPKLHRYQAHHDLVLHKYLPKLKRHLDKQGIETGLYTIKWYFQCFLDRVSISHNIPKLLLSFEKYYVKSNFSFLDSIQFSPESLGSVFTKG